MTVGPANDVLTVRQTQEELGVSRRRIMQLLDEDKLPGSFKLGLQRFIPRSSVERRKRQVAKWRVSRGL